jgi:hypothetical protein
LPSAWNDRPEPIVEVNPGKLSVAPAVAESVPAEAVIEPLTVSLVLEPETVKEPPAIEKPPVIVEVVKEIDDKVREPPVIASGSLADSELTDLPPESIVTVGVAPGTSMTTSSPGPGTCPVLQLLSTSQDPLVAEIQSTVARSCRRSRAAIQGRHQRRLARDSRTRGTFLKLCDMVPALRARSGCSVRVTCKQPARGGCPGRMIAMRLPTGESEAALTFRQGGRVILGNAPGLDRSGRVFFYR